MDGWDVDGFIKLMKLIKNPTNYDVFKIDFYFGVYIFIHLFYMRIVLKTAHYSLLEQGSERAGENAKLVFGLKVYGIG